jgi:hypothetical protein
MRPGTAATEITTCCVRDASWWKNFNVVAKGAKQGFADGGNRDKLVITSEIDDNIESVHYGEINNAAVLHKLSSTRPKRPSRCC